MRSTIMNTTKKFFVSLSLCCLLGLTVALSAMENTTGADFLKVPVGGRSSAMGESISVIADDVEALNYNPAGLGQMQQMQFFYEHAEWFQSIRFEALSYGTPLKLLAPGQQFPGVIAIAFRFFYVAPIQGYGNWGEQLEEMKFGAYNIRAGYSLKIADSDTLKLMAGASVSFSGKSLDPDPVEDKFFKPGLDLGAVAEINHGISSIRTVFGPAFKVGLVFNNIGFIKTGINENIPFTGKLGLGFRLFDTANLNIDLIQEVSSSAFKANLGGEYWFKDMIALRLGGKLGVDQLNHFTWGIGIKYPVSKYMMSFDYAMLPFSDVGLTHKFSLKMDIPKIEIKFPDRTELLYYKGIDFFVHNEYANAIEMWQRVLKKTPDHEEAKLRIQETQAIIKREEHQKGLGTVESEFEKYMEEAETDE